MSEEIAKVRKRIKSLIWFFIVALLISGITAFPLNFEISILHNISGKGSFIETIIPWFSDWIELTYKGITETSEKYPFLLYGTDWLAFAHIVIAIAFIGPLKDPVKNIWVIEFGMISCVLIIPLALICGPIRGIPFFWTLIDCSFGILGIIPLLLVRKNILLLEKLVRKNGSSQ